MKWSIKNLCGGVIVASQTTSGDFKDIAILSQFDNQWFTVSLLDGLCTPPCSAEEIVERFNKYYEVPLPKVLGSGQMPENRMGLPMVQIFGLRGHQ